MVQLVSELRRLKDESGLSLARFAGRTGYSASSWERYLGGRALPPRAAVDAVARATGADADRLLALHAVAAAAWQRQPQPEAGSEDEVEAEATEERERSPERAAVSVEPGDAAGSGAPTGGRRRRGIWRQVLIAVVAAALGSGTTLVLEAAWAAPAGNAAHGGVDAKPVIYTCRYTREHGLWYAGNSTTSTRTLVVDLSGPDVAELQCLLQRVGITPGGVDGSFGPLTESAVIQAQKRFHLDVDGQVGPRTWAALRG